ncbi:MAG: mannose-1-phosphate guanylyltransferase/mannose-6-phosphate isomerase [Rickettsiaceae bacterium]|nr:mannose-1-phosphate guanylyltransferase/mannose-6-phosphate isomerase [Rickettsiaceae bacterium]
MQAVVLSGGVGSRLWPASNKTHPKPFMQMDDGQSLLQKSFIRAVKIQSITNIITVTAHNLLPQTQIEYDKASELLGKTIPLQYILEPSSKNTAAAIAIAALFVHKNYGPDETMLILPADHIISNQLSFEKAVIQAEKLASNGNIVTFGMNPNKPESGYGYIEHEGNDVIRFVEKPSLELAKKYISKGNFLWNAGIFCFKASSIIQEMRKYCPDIIQGAQRSIDASSCKKPNHLELDAFEFDAIPEQSIDYALMEKSKNLKVISCDIGWKDIGNWSSLSEYCAVDHNGNNVKGNATLHNVSNCYIENSGQLLGVVGVHNLAIININNGFLVTNKQDSEEVRKIYSQLQNNAQNIQLFSWGSIKTVQENQGIKIKKIKINPRTSAKIDEYFDYSANWMIVQGITQFTVNNKISTLRTNESNYIQAQDKFSIKNIGNDILIIITVQLDDYLFQNDIMPYIEINKV